MTRRRHLRDQFGPEYERTVEAGQSRGAAERDLKERDERHEAQEIRPLPSTVRDRYARDWASVQEHFADRPDQAVGEADRLVTTLMSERGLTTGPNVTARPPAPQSPGYSRPGLVDPM